MRQRCCCGVRRGCRGEMRTGFMTVSRGDAIGAGGASWGRRRRWIGDEHGTGSPAVIW
jgi:hypothetical protein